VTELRTLRDRMLLIRHCGYFLNVVWSYFVDYRDLSAIFRIFCRHFSVMYVGVFTSVFVDAKRLRDALNTSDPVKPISLHQLEPENTDLKRDNEFVIVVILTL